MSSLFYEGNYEIQPTEYMIQCPKCKDFMYKYKKQTAIETTIVTVCSNYLCQYGFTNIYQDEKWVESIPYPLYSEYDDDDISEY